MRPTVTGDVSDCLNSNHLNFLQIFVDQRTPEITVVTRHNPINHESVIFIAHSAASSGYLNHYATDVVVDVEGFLYFLF